MIASTMQNLLSRSFHKKYSIKMAELATLHSKNSFIDMFDTFFFDCDGVIWSGDKEIENVPKVLNLLVSAGKKIIFVSNNSSKSRRVYLAKYFRHF
jgi:4-nitrophenyl phosphatase